MRVFLFFEKNRQICKLLKKVLTFLRKNGIILKLHDFDKNSGGIKNGKN